MILKKDNLMLQLIGTTTSFTIYNYIITNIGKFFKNFFEIKRSQKVVKRPNFFSWPNKTKRSQNRVIWPPIGQTTNPDGDFHLFCFVAKKKTIQNGGCKQEIFNEKAIDTSVA